MPDASFSWFEIGIPFLRNMLSEMRIILLNKPHLTLMHLKRGEGIRKDFSSSFLFDIETEKI